MTDQAQYNELHVVPSKRSMTASEIWLELGNSSATTSVHNIRNSDHGIYATKVAAISPTSETLLRRGTAATVRHERLKLIPIVTQMPLKRFEVFPTQSQLAFVVQHSANERYDQCTRPNRQGETSSFTANEHVKTAERRFSEFEIKILSLSENKRIIVPQRISVIVKHIFKAGRPGIEPPDDMRMYFLKLSSSRVSKESSLPCSLIFSQSARILRSLLGCAVRCIRGFECRLRNRICPVTKPPHCHGRTGSHYQTQASERKSNEGNKCCCNAPQCRPSLPPDNAVLCQRPTLAHAIQHAHSLIPLRIGRHFAMSAHCPYEVSGKQHMEARTFFTDSEPGHIAKVLRSLKRLLRDRVDEIDLEAIETYT